MQGCMKIYGCLWGSIGLHKGSSRGCVDARGMLMSMLQEFNVIVANPVAHRSYLRILTELGGQSIQL